MANEEIKPEATQPEETQAVVSETQAPPATTQEPAWTPSYKYKVAGEEKEIDEDLRHAIKDAQTEKKMKELFEKANGLDVYKTKYVDLDGKYRELNTKHTEREAQLQKLYKNYEAGDDEAFFNGLGVPDNVILRYAAKKIKEMDMPEEMKQLYNDNKVRKSREEQLQEQLEEYQAKAEQEAVLSRTFQLDNELERPDVKETAQAYDALYGNGAFRNEVIRLGQFEALKNGNDLPAKEAVAYIVGKAKPIIERIGRPTQEQHKPPVIPNVKGNPSTPAKRSVGSIDDIKEMAAKM